MMRTDWRGLQSISAERMRHILDGHRVATTRSRSFNSKFNAEYSNATELQNLCKSVFSDPFGPPIPFGFGGLVDIEGQVLGSQDGVTFPYPIGTDKNGVPTNRVRIRYDPVTGDVQTMFPVEAR